MPAHSPVGAKIYVDNGRSSDLSHPFVPSQNQRGSNDILQKACFVGLTAAGTVPDFHRIPFYPDSMIEREPFRVQS